MMITRLEKAETILTYSLNCDYETIRFIERIDGELLEKALEKLEGMPLNSNTLLRMVFETFLQENKELLANAKKPLLIIDGGKSKIIFYENTPQSIIDEYDNLIRGL